MHYFSIFFKKLTNCVNFSRVGRRTQIVGNFEKFLKIFDKNSIGKLIFYRFLEKLLLKIEPSEITLFFYN